MDKEQLVNEIFKRVQEILFVGKVDNDDSHYILDMSENGEVPKDFNKAIYIKNLSVDAVSQIATGLCVNAKTAFVRQAFLLGKKLYTSAKEIELYTYKQTAAPDYYDVLQKQLILLEKSGLIIDDASQCTSSVCNLSGSIRLDKRVITERDIKSQNVGKIVIGKKSLVTDLAKDYAKERNITIVREDGSR